MQELDTRPTDLLEYLSLKGYDTIAVDGYKVINTYSSLEKELECLYTGVGLRNISHKGIIELKGKDVLDFLHRISTNSLKDIQKANIKSTLFTSACLLYTSPSPRD